MAWNLVNIPLPDESAIFGGSETHKELVTRLVLDGYEPFSTASLGDGIVVSFRRWEEQMTPTFTVGELPGQYL